MFGFAGGSGEFTQRIPDAQAALEQIGVVGFLAPAYERGGGIGGQTSSDQLMFGHAGDATGIVEGADPLRGALLGQLGDFEAGEEAIGAKALTQFRRNIMLVLQTHTAHQQFIDSRLIAFLGEEVIDRAGDFTADIGYELEQWPWQMADQFESAEPCGQGLGRAFADMLDAEGEKKAFQRGLLAVLDGLDQVFGPFGRDLAGLDGFRRGAIALVGAALHLDEIVETELVQIGDRDNETEIAEVLDQAGAEAFDIHRAARGEVDDRFLRWAGQISSPEQRQTT